MGILIGAVIVVLLLAVIYLGIGGYVAFNMTKVGDHPQFSDDPATFGVDYERIFFYSREDHLKIAAWYLPHEDTSRAIVLVHGRDASKQNAISGKMPKLASELHQSGFAVLALDLRGHGESEEKRYTWGVREQRDVLGSVDFLLQEGFNPGSIGVLGISLGGAAVINAAYQESAIGAVAVESTFADLDALVKPNWKKESGLPLFLIPGVYWMWNNFYRFDLSDVKPYQQLATLSPRPVLILHCESDEVVPVSHAKQLKQAYPRAELVLFNNCSHAEIYRDHPKGYLDALIPFLQQEWE